jgi:hypothetical protein
MKVNKKQNAGLSGSRKSGRANDMVAKSQRRLAASRVPRVSNSVAAAYSTGNSGRAPNVTMSKDSCRVVHRELLGNVSGTGTTAFTIASTFALNPGVVQTFPWLSNMAQNWETYRFNSLRICYYTRTGSNTAGSVLIVPDYDPTDVSPITEQTASAFEDIQEDAPWKDIVCRLRPAAMHGLGPRKYIRSGALGLNLDLKTYDSGNVFICTVDSAGVAGWGKLWIEYDVIFFTPQLPSAGGSFSQINGIQSNGGTTGINMFGTAPVITGNMGDTALNNVLTVNNMIVGAEYELSMAFSGTVISVVSNPTVTGMTLKSSLLAAFNAAATAGGNIVTYVATATTGTITPSITATTISSSSTTFVLIPTSIF